MNILEIKNSVPTLMKHNIVPFLWGQQGVGKTQVVKQIADSLNYDLIHLHLATQEVGDLVGLLVHTADGTVRHARPEWFPTHGNGILFLDELNRAHPDVLQALFSLITGGTIHTHRLPSGWKIVAAGNYQSEGFTVTDTSDAAWMSRFCHIDFVPSTEEFITFAEENGADDVAAFIRTQPDLLEIKPKSRPALSLVSPDRRAWKDMIGKLDLEPGIEDFRYELYSGIIGATAAAAYITWKKEVYSNLSGRRILKEYDKLQKEVRSYSDKKECRLDKLNSAVEEIFSILGKKKSISDSELDNFKAFLLDIPLELSLKVVKKLHSVSWPQKNKILNSKEFVSKFAKSKL